jgi:hypothetical protein
VAAASPVLGNEKIEANSVKERAIRDFTYSVLEFIC